MDNHYMKNIISFFHTHSKLKTFVILLEKYSTLPVMFSFYATIGYLAFNLDYRCFFVAGIPWLSYFFVTVIRNKLNLERPFQVLNFTPLVTHSPNRACPSRHASSSVVIAFAIYSVFPPLAYIIGGLSLIICATRVLTGVHFLRDVLWGALIGAVFGYVGFIIIL